MLRNTSSSYGWVSIFAHWISAIAVIGLFGVGFWMVDLDYYSSWYKTAPDLHKSVGILLAVLIVLRITWKVMNANPAPIGNVIEKKAAHGVHGLLYLLLFSMFISGYLISTADGRGIEVFTWFEVPGLGSFIENQEDLAGEVHEYLAYSLIGLVALHALAAFFHHIVHKDRTLIRMLKPNKMEEEK